MANTIGYGQGAVNNTIDWGKAPTNNTIDFGEVCADSWSPETNLVGGTSFSNTQSINLDGIDDYVNVGTSSLGITSAITVSAWVKIPTTNTGGGGTNIQVIACEDNTSGGQRNWNLYWRGTGSNHFAWIIWNSNGTSNAALAT